ncbi:hypothetical protein F0Q45_18630 [Mycobacterium simiae]|uniref:Uncharacterized protein n=1 Tax=Mycobacterium simiae TaxID=1784 RepID=A0A5B1BJG0_MYCSI|nr:hypothetical protein [Mycobacterium simiae]KAA1248798.1 hypothetical protein F0Q45_18630 [Mycobacterium simiae]
MKFTITCADGVKINGDISVGQEFKVADSGVLTFFDAPEGEVRHATAFSPSAWVSVSYPAKASKSSDRKAFVMP